jgi:GT2 family glycosyltransferase
MDASGQNVDIVIVNWNSRRRLRECLAALDQSSIAAMLSVIIVDNASTDGSVDGLRVYPTCDAR